MMMGEEQSRMLRAGFACGCLTFFVVLIVVLSSINSIEPLQQGLLYSSYSKSIVDNEVYQPGKYLLGPGKYFMLFPSTQQTIEFSRFSKYGPVRAKTGKEGQGEEPQIDVGPSQGGGLNLTLSVSLQYQFKPEYLHGLYSAYKLNYERPFRLELEETFRQIASGYTQFDWWHNLDEVLADMDHRLDVACTNLHIQFVSAQLLEVALDHRFEQAVIRTQVEEERKKRAEFELQIETIRQEMEVIQADAAAEVRIIDATAQAEKTRIVQEANSKAAAIRLEAEGTAYSEIANILGFNPAELLSYIKYMMLEDKIGSKVLVDITPEAVTPISL